MGMMVVCLVLCQPIYRLASIEIPIEQGQCAQEDGLVVLSSSMLCCHNFETCMSSCKSAFSQASSQNVMKPLISWFCRLGLLAMCSLYWISG